MPEKSPTKQPSIQGLKYLKNFHDIGHMLRDLYPNPNRKMHYDQLLALILLRFFDPVMGSLRKMKQATHFKTTRKKLKVPRTSLGVLSAATSTFDPSFLIEIIEDISEQLQPNLKDPRLSQIDQVLTAVDGTLLKALPRVAWALWFNDQNRAAKAHVFFEIAKGVATSATITDANTSEIAVLKTKLEAGRLYILDRGYAKYSLFQDIIDNNSSLVARIRNNATYETIEEKPLSEAAKEAGVVSDRVVRLGSKTRAKKLKQALRIVEFTYESSANRSIRMGRQRRRGKPKWVTIQVATDKLDLPAEVIALIYAYRWQIELFFRWFKCVLGSKHLMAHSQNGITIQMYAALIASMLVSLWSGRKPNKQDWTTLVFYLRGWADLDEVIEELRSG